MGRKTVLTMRELPSRASRPDRDVLARIFGGNCLANGERTDECCDGNNDSCCSGKCTTDFTDSNPRCLG